MHPTAIDDRLLSAAEMVRQGAVFADVGCDHAYLSLFLLRAGIIRRAVCTDVAEAPLRRAGEHIRDCGFSSLADTVLCDGMKGLEGYGITDAAICGMGGEMIARILEEAPLVRNPTLRLILQPMTRQAHLRRFLWGAGFRIEREIYSEAAGKPYVCLLASYTGEVSHRSEFEEEFGAFTSAPTPAMKVYIRRKYRALRAAHAGSGGREVSAELLRRCEEFLAAGEGKL